MAENIQKIYAPVIVNKSSGGQVTGVSVILSDTSIDRDEEIIGKKFLERAANEDSFLPALMDHENKALNLINGWVNKRVVKSVVDGEEHYALIAEPQWFMSNEKAVTIRNMIEKDGAPMGVSITAIPSGSESVKKGGKNYKQWTDGEIISADWVGIPSNRHAAAVQRMAKSFSLEQSEVPSMDEKQVQELSKTLLDSVKAGFAEQTEKLSKKEDLSVLIEKVEKLTERLDSIEKNEEAPKEPEKELEEKVPELKSKVPDLKKAAKELEEKRAELSKMPEANNGVTKDVDDGDYSTAGFIKAYRAR